MRASNKLARLTLLDRGYDHIWFKPHTARNDVVFSQKGNYLATDLFNLFDGMCWFNDELIFFQVKTNSWPIMKPYTEFMRNKTAKVLIINVTNKLVMCKGKYKVIIRELEY